MVPCSASGGGLERPGRRIQQRTRTQHPEPNHEPWTEPGTRHPEPGTAGMLLSLDQIGCV